MTERARERRYGLKVAAALQEAEGLTCVCGHQEQQHTFDAKYCRECSCRAFVARR